LPERGKRAFNGVNGGPYGGRDVDGKYYDKEVHQIDADFVDRGRGNSPAFGIRHYAAEVSYDCRGWIEKDKNNPTDEMTACLCSSSDDTFMCPVFSAPPKPGKASVTAAFCTSLKALITTLGQTDNNFVRCLKASNPLAKRVFQSALVLKQLKYTGMLDTLKIRAFGFPISKDYKEFRGWAKILAQDVAPEPLDDAVEGMVAHLQATYAEEIFAELPKNDQITKATQKDMAIVQGKPNDAVKDTPVVMMRDWFHRGLVAKKRELLKVHYQMVACVTRAAERANDYCVKKQATEDLKPLVRAVVSRMHYLKKKHKKLDMDARTNLTLFIRANLARSQYYQKRAAHFEVENRHQMQMLIHATVKRQEFYQLKLRAIEKDQRHKAQDLIYATVKRQEFYQLKLRAIEKDLRHKAQDLIHATVMREIFREQALLKASNEVQHKESKLFRKQFKYAAIQQIEMLEEKEARDLALSDMFKEDQYASDLFLARELEKFSQVKEIVMMTASEARKKAGDAMACVNHVLAQSDDGYEAAYTQNQQKIEHECELRLKQTMIQMGLISEGRPKLALPRLIPLPNEHSDRHVRKNYFRHLIKSLATKRGIITQKVVHDSSAAELHQTPRGGLYDARGKSIPTPVPRISNTPEMKQAFTPERKQQLIERVAQITQTRDIRKMSALLEDL